MNKLHFRVAAWCTLWALAFGLLCAPASAQDASVAVASTSAIAPATDAWRAALPHDPAAATQAYLARLSPEARARSDAYFEGGYWLSLWNLLWGLATAWLLLQTGPAQAARRWCAARSQRRFVQVLSYSAFYFLASWLLELPLTIYQGFVREHQYGMATQAFPAWFGEQLLNLGLGVAIGPCRQ